METTIHTLNETNRAVALTMINAHDTTSAASIGDFNYFKIATVIMRVPEKDFTVPYDCLSPEEKAIRRNHTRPASTEELKDSIRKYPVTYNAGMFLKKLCISTERFDLLDVIIENQPPSQKKARKRVQIDESANTTVLIPARVMEQPALEKDDEHNARALQNSMLLANFFRTLASRE